ncbi:EGF-like domain-containing protein [Tieghemostelium lacteum]|uniref:EGF-like domain-containing protein n=1 Tax=Tieghemostelium lacteum TaxID=361077 RepID=A0A152A1Z4_TIELA|nr:EGF-like domain-containing protein [Tieghemostelium lacteum]|eukprot:KYR00224.1 EGF-like domain-containing protein [Tieghemostelium lacteum]
MVTTIIHKFIYICIIIFHFGVINGQFRFLDLVVPGSNNVYGSDDIGCEYFIKFQSYDESVNVIYIYETPPRYLGSTLQGIHSLYAELTFRSAVGSNLNVSLQFRDSNNPLQYNVIYEVNDLYWFPVCERQPYPLDNYATELFYTPGESYTFYYVMKFLDLVKFAKLTFSQTSSPNFYKCSGEWLNMKYYLVTCNFVVEPGDISATIPVTIEYRLTNNENSYQTYSVASYMNNGQFPISDIIQRFYPNDTIGIYQWPNKFYQELTVTNPPSNIYRYIVPLNVATSLPPGTFVKYNPYETMFIYGNLSTRTYIDTVSVPDIDSSVYFQPLTLDNMVAQSVFTGSPREYNVMGSYSKPQFSLLTTTISTLLVLDQRYQVQYSFSPFYWYRMNINEYSRIMFYEFPYGITSIVPYRTLNEYTLEVPLTVYSTDISYYRDGVISDYSYIGSLVDTAAPRLEPMEFEYVNSQELTLIRLIASDMSSGFSFIEFYFVDSNDNRFETIFQVTSEDLVDGSVNDGVYETLVKPYKFYSPEYSIKATYSDQVGNIGDISEGISFIPDFPFLVDNKNQLVGNSNITITSFSFLENEVNLTSDGFTNVLKFTCAGTPMNSFVSIGLVFDAGSEYYERFFGSFDTVEQVYKIEFYLPPRLQSGPIQYFIEGQYFKFSYIALRAITNLPTNLSVVSNWSERFPPMVTNLVPFSETVNGIIKCSFNITIEDQGNGFKSGIVSIWSDIDPQLRNFTLSSNGYNKYLDTYQISFTLNQSECVNQSFEIYYLSLTDTNNLTSDSSGNLKFNSFMKILDTIQGSLTIEDCQSPPSTINPTLTNLTILNNLPINVGSSQRDFDILFEVTDSSVPVSKHHIPYCYISTIFLRQIKVPSVFVQFLDSSKLIAQWRCSGSVPYGFGARSIGGEGNNLTISIYGFANIGLSFGGSSNTFNGYYLTTEFNISPIIEDIKLSPMPGLSRYLKMDIFGRQLKGVLPKLNILYQDSIYPDVLEITYQSYTFMSGIRVRSNVGYANVTVRFNDTQTNTFTIFTGNPPVTPSPESPKCQGTPECGGPSNGLCTDRGCQCKSPWIGPTCQSQIVIITPPYINTTSPTIDNDFNVTLPDGEIVSLRNLISIVQLNEYNYQGQLKSSFQFTRWKFTNTTLSNQTDYQEYLYESEIANKKSNITVTIQYYNKKMEITFANENLVMQPSSIKYKIFIDGYAFESSLNYLELVMSVALESLDTDDDQCSLSQFGTSNEGENSQNDFVKLQIGEHSLYGRFIRRGIIDGNRITNVTNRLVSTQDLGLNPVQQQYYKSQEFISMRIPNFHSNSTLDPDFSVLIDTSTVDNKNSNSVCSNNHSKSGLTKSKLAGIIIGSILFALAIVIITIYIINKSRKHKLFIKNLNEKAQEFQ